MSDYFSDCSSDHGTFKKVKRHLGSKCPSSYCTLKASIASQVLTSTGGSTSLKLYPSSLYHSPSKASFGILLKTSAPQSKVQVILLPNLYSLFFFSQDLLPVLALPLQNPTLTLLICFIPMSPLSQLFFLGNIGRVKRTRR